MLMRHTVIRCDDPHPTKHRAPPHFLSVLTIVLGVAYLGSTPLGFVDVFWVPLGNDGFLADVETGAKGMSGDVEAVR